MFIKNFISDLKKVHPPLIWSVFRLRDVDAVFEEHVGAVGDAVVDEFVFFCGEGKFWDDVRDYFLTKGVRDLGFGRGQEFFGVAEGVLRCLNQVDGDTRGIIGDFFAEQMLLHAGLYIVGDAVVHYFVGAAVVAE